MVTETIYEKTPNGGDYSKIWYYDDNMVPVEPEKATKFIIHEYKNDGKLVKETVGIK